MKFSVYELRLKLYALQSISQEDALIKVASFVDHVLLQSEGGKELHIKNCQKGYVFSGLYPLAQDGKYQKDVVYQVILRTVDVKLARYFLEKLPKHENQYFKGIVCNIHEIPRKHISTIYSITPIVVKGDGGYWKDSMSFDEFRQQIQSNLLKKYKNLSEESLDETAVFMTQIERKNKVPIKIKYKDVYLLADKVQIYVSENSVAQTLAYLSLGTGIGTMNARGLGFVNYRFE